VWCFGRTFGGGESWVGRDSGGEMGGGLRVRFQNIVTYLNTVWKLMFSNPNPRTTKVCVFGGGGGGYHADYV
jgi:hypothetical protein